MRGIHLGTHPSTTSPPGTGSGRITFTVVDDVLYLVDPVTGYVYEAPVTFVGPTNLPSGLITADADTLYFHYSGGTWQSPATQSAGTAPVGGIILNDRFFVTIASVTYEMPVTPVTDIPGVPGGETSLVTIDGVEYLRIVFPDGEVRYEEVHETPTPDAAGGSGIGTSDGTNTWVGTDSGNANTTGVQNTALGYRALDQNTSGNYNVGVGDNTLGGNATAHSNTAIGSGALASNTAAPCNTAIGRNALVSTNGVSGLEDDGDSNTAIGYNAMVLNTTGASNVAIGASVMEQNHDGNENVAVGQHALNLNTDGSFHTAIGAYALQSTVNTQNNTACGYAALQNAVGYGNTALGTQAGRTVTSGQANLFLGCAAGYYETGSNKLFIDNQTRANEADGRAKALVYGIFDPVPANQRFTINGQLTVTHGIVGGGGGVATSDSPTWSAAHIFAVAGAADTPAIRVTGLPFVGGTATTTKPLMLLEPTGTTSAAWSTLGTMLGVNAASGFAGNLIDAQVNGVSTFKVGSNGAVTSGAGGIFPYGVSVTNGFGFTSTQFATGMYLSGTAPYVFLYGAGLPIRIGNVPSASPVAQTLTIGEASRPGTDSNVAGANGTVQSGLGTGTGTASSLIFQTPTLAGAGSATQTYATRLTLDAQGATVAGNVFTNVFRGNYYSFDNGGGFYGIADGVIRVTDSSGTNFSRLQLGGTTASFPAIKRNAAGIDFRTADDSAYCAITASSMEVLTVGNGFILKSPDGTRYRIAVANGGALSTAAA